MRKAETQTERKAPPGWERDRTMLRAEALQVVMVELSAATLANFEALGVRTPVLSDFADMAGGRA